MQQSRFGIYLNVKESKARRVNSPYGMPAEGDKDWACLTPEVNMTLLNIRKLAGEKKLVAQPDSIVWE